MGHMRNHSGVHHRTETIRRYSMGWLLQAACRVYQRGAELHREHERRVRRAGISGLFDLSDTGAVSGNWRRLGSS